MNTNIFPLQCPCCQKYIRKLLNGDIVEHLDNYSDYWIFLSDYTKMKIGLCRDCGKNMNKTKANKIVNNHNKYWETEAKEKGNTEQRLKFIGENKVKAILFAKNELELNKKIGELK